MMRKNNLKRFWEAPVQLDDLKNYQGLEDLYNKIEELCSKVTEESIPERFKVKIINPIKRIFAYKSFTADIKRLKREIQDLVENKANIICKSLEKYSLKWKYEDIAKDTKHLEEQIK